jgi:hypothetical protein
MQVGLRVQGPKVRHKIAVPRHRVLSRRSADALERALERKVRRAARKACQEHE